MFSGSSWLNPNLCDYVTPTQIPTPSPTPTSPPTIIPSLIPTPSPTPEPFTPPPACTNQAGALGPLPIEFFSGQKVKTQIDYEDAGAFPLSVVRHYRSGAGAVGEPNPLINSNSADFGIVPLGAGWRLGLGGKLLPSGDTPAANNSPSLTARLWDGSQATFDGMANGDGSAISYTPRVPGQGSLVYQHSAIEADRRWVFSPAGSPVQWRFNSTGQLLEQRQASGQTQSYSYNAAGQLQAVVDAFSRSLQLAYNSVTGLLLSIITPDAQTISYSHDAQNRLTGVTRNTDSSTSTTLTYHYEDSRFPNALTGITDEAGIRWQSYAYDAEGRAISSQLAGGVEGNQVSYTTSTGSGSSSSTTPTISAAAVTDALGTTRHYQYGMNAGRLAVLSASSVAGDPDKDSAAARVQNAAGYIDSQTDFLGVQTQYEYDGQAPGSAASAYSRGLRTKTTIALGQPEEQSSRTQWHPSYALPLEIIEAGRTAGSGAALADLRKTSYTYSNTGQIQSIHTQDLQNPSAPAQTISLTWYGDTPADPAAFKGLLKSYSTAAAGITTLTYNNLGLLATSTNALGQTTGYSHDLAGRITAITAPDGSKTTYSYNLRGWLTSRSQYATGSGAAYATDSFTYTPSGLLQTASLAEGVAYSYQYDDARRLTAWSANDGRSVQYDYDNASNRTAERWYQNGSPTWERTYAYSNANNRLQASFVGYGALNQFYSYDANAAVSAQRLYRGEEIADINSLEALPALASYGRDALGRITSTTLADGPDGSTNAASATAIAHLQWDALNHLSSATDPKGIATQYQNDALGRNEQEQSADMGQTSTTYLANGQPSVQTDARGLKTQYSYDALGRPTTIAWGAQGTASLIGMAGGSAGDMAPLGSTQIQWDGGTPTASTPATGKISHITQAWGSRSYGYNAAGLLASDSVSLNSGQSYSTQYSYTPSGQISQIQDGFANQAVPSGGGVPSTTTSYTWSQGRIVAIARNGKTLISGIQYDALGRPTDWRWADGQIARRRYDSGGGLMLANNFAGYGYDWYAGRITGITQNLYMPKTDAAEDELGFALQSNIYQIGYDQRGRIKSFGRSAQATVGLPAIHETLNFAWDKNGNPTQITGSLKAMAIGSSTSSNTGAAQARTATTANTASPAAADLASSLTLQPLPQALRQARAGRKALGFKTLPIPPSRLTALAARPPSPRSHAAGAFDLQGKALIHSDKDSDYIYSAAQPDAGNYNAAGIDTSAATAAVSGAPAYATSASLGKGKGLQGLGLSAAPSANSQAAPAPTAAPSPAAKTPATASTYGSTSNTNSSTTNSPITTNNLTDPTPEPVQAGYSVNYTLAVNPSASNRSTGAELTASFIAPGATAPEFSDNRNLNWPHDAAGNLLRDFNDNFQLGYDAAGRLARTSAWGSSAFQFYDLSGQRIFKTDSQGDSSFDSQNPAGSLNPSTAGVFYQYDPNGNLLWQQTVGPASTGLLQNEAATHYYWLPNEHGDILIGFDQGINSYAVYTDHLNTPRLVTKIENPQNPRGITDTANDLPEIYGYGQPQGISPLAIPVWQWSYSPFGADLANGYEAKPTTIGNNFKPDLWTWTGLPETGGADPNQVAQETWRIQANLSTPPTLNIRYPGQYYDFEVGLVQNWWRTYEPRIGRYVSADPIGLDGGWNRWQYVGGNPFNGIDPNGLDLMIITGGVRDGSLNIFGHTGSAVQGYGMASYGNDTPLGSSVQEYLTSQSAFRVQQVTIVPTTQAQDAAAIAFIKAHPDMNDVGKLDNCAVRTNQVLNAAGIRTNGVPFPGGLARDVQKRPRVKTYLIPQNGSIPPELSKALERFRP